MSSTPPAESPPPEPPRKAKRRDRPERHPGESLARILRPIANWQAKLSWSSACWGLIPIAGLPLGAIAFVFGVLGYRRFRRNPEDLGIRMAVGGMVLGPIEVIVNLIGVSCIGIGLRQLIP